MGKKAKDFRAPNSLSNPSQRPLVWLICSLLVLAVFIMFGQTLTHEFIICDDDIYLNHENVANGFSWEGFKWACTRSFAGNWHPLTWLSHMIDVECYGNFYDANMGVGWPGGHHLTNVILHAAAVIFLFLALRLMTGAMWRSAIVALIFAIHPLRAESVAWLAERKDVLCGMFWMLTMLAYAWYVKKPGIGRYLTVFLSLGVGLSAKSMLVTLPCVLLLLDYWPLRRFEWGPPEKAEKNGPSGQSVFRQYSLSWLIVEKIPLFALSAVVSAVLVIAQRSFGAMSMSVPLPLGTRIANALVSYVLYLEKMAWPVNLAFFYPHPGFLGKEPLWWTVVKSAASIAFLAAITWIAVRNYRKRPYMIVGWFWYLGTLIPVIGLVQVGIQGMADRYTYIPSIGIYMLVVWGAAELSAKYAGFRDMLKYAAPLLLLLLLALGCYQVSTWKSSEKVFVHAIRAVDNNYFAHNHYGLVFDHKAAEARAKGNIVKAKEYLDKAGEEFHTAVSIDPNYDSANSNYGLYFLKTDRVDQAIPYFKKAVSVNKYFFGAWANLGNAYLIQNRLDNAITELQRAIDIATERTVACPQYHQILSDCYFRKGQIREALKEREIALETAPNSPALMVDIANILATYPDASVRDGKKALELTQRASKLCKDSDPIVFRAMAAAYAEMDQFSEAKRTALKALQFAERQNHQALIQAIKSDIPFYEEQKPLRMSLPSPPKSE